MSPLTFQGRGKQAFALFCLLLGGFSLGASPAEALVDRAKLQGWGEQTYSEIDRTLRVSGTLLYAESASLSGTQSGGFNNRAFVWPVSTQFRVLNSLTQLSPATYRMRLRVFSDQVDAAYWNNGYRSGAGGGDRFYDDNAHLVVALAEAYRLTGDAAYLNRAKATQTFVLSGENTIAGGGIYFKQGDTTSKDTISTLQGARGAAMLYRATGDVTYLNDAKRLLTWAKSHVQLSNGLFNQGFSIASNTAAGVDIVNSAGIGISLNCELYAATREASYLIEARRIGFAAVTRFLDAPTGRINDEGYWAYELVDAFANLHTFDPNSGWLNRSDTALTWLHNNKRDPNGHYDTFWGRNGPITTTLTSWNLNEQASVARAYLYTAIAVPEPLTALAIALPFAGRRRR